MKNRSARLYFREGSSDKVYEVDLVGSGTAWTVNFAYGRRGNSLTTGTKTPQPVVFATAERLFDKIVNEKLAKGYQHQPGSGSVTGSAPTMTSTQPVKTASGYAPQLPLPLDESLLASILKNADWGAQEKMDGENRQLLIEDGVPRGINRKAQFVDLPVSYLTAAKRLPDCFLVGEAMGDKFCAFDLLEYEGKSLRQRPFSARYAQLEKVLASTRSPNWWDEPSPFSIVPLATGAADKAALLDKVRDANGEGVVFVRLDAEFASGKGRSKLKHKFVESATCLVIGINTQRSVEVGLLDEDGDMVPVGNVTIPVNEAIPCLDSLVEIRYLYRFDQGSLEQPVYLGERSDLDRSDAVLSQISRIKAKTLMEA